MPDSKNFSLKAVILTAIVSFVISGFGGFFLSEWQNRAKPEITISSIGFSPSKELIKIDANLQEITKTSSWSRAYKQYENYSSIDEDYKVLTIIERRLKRGIENTNQWLAQHKEWEHEIITNISIANLKENPYCQDGIVGSVLIGSMRRNEIAPPPVSMTTVKEMPEVAELFRDDHGWRIHLGTQSTGFPDEDADSRESKNSIELLANSYARGCNQNIYFYMNKFIEITYKDIQAVQDHKLKLEKLLLPASHLNLSVSIYNSGKSPLTLKPYMALSFQNDELKKEPLFLEIKDGDYPIDTPTNIFDNLPPGSKKTEEGIDVKVDSFLPNTEGGKYVFIEPTSGVTITLSSIEPLGQEKGNRILSLFESNALRSQLIAISNEGKTIRSSSVIFGKSISMDDKELIKEATLNTGD